MEVTAQLDNIAQKVMENQKNVMLVTFVHIYSCMSSTHLICAVLDITAVEVPLRRLQLTDLQEIFVHRVTIVKKDLLMQQHVHLVILCPTRVLNLKMSVYLVLLDIIVTNKVCLNLLVLVPQVITVLEVKLLQALLPMLVTMVINVRLDQLNQRCAQ